jgi:hypothetical protein
MLLEGWEIDIERLPGPKRGQSPALYVSDKLVPSPSGSLAALVYSIYEIRMGWEVGLFTLFEDKSNPTCILNPANFLCFSTEDTVTWLSDQLLALKKYAYDNRGNRIELPFAIIDIAGRRFSFIPIVNSLPYSISLEGNGLRLKENYRDERFPSEHNRFNALADLSWHPSQELSKFVDVYYAGCT